MNNTFIVTGGDIDISFAKRYYEENDITLVIAVDNGLLALSKLKIKPDVIVGDFDTVDSSLLGKYEGIAEIIKFNPEKDNSDTEIAIDVAMERESFAIHIIGGFGNRIDHMLANISLLKKTLDAGIDTVIFDKNNRVFALGNKRKTVEIKKSDFKYVSLIPFGGEVLGINTQGMKYELENDFLSPFEKISRGISNEILSDKAKISIEQGTLLVIESRD
ncbi:thiamine pyrophosphokinase [Lachnospiraceae bacterium RM5]|nr:thiamine pyrophosphokinase [Lachnospiraceae bacterium RM5]